MSRNLNDLSMLFRPLADRFLYAAAQHRLDLLVTCTLRTFAEQDALYAQGREVPGRIVTNAKSGESAHNFGLAIDIVPMINGKPEWTGTSPAWELAGQLGEDLGLEWAGRWTKFIEKPHFQLPNWPMHKAGSDAA